MVVLSQYGINIGKIENLGTQREAQIQNLCSVFIKSATNTAEEMRLRYLQ
jgi:hypothetical protein